MVPAEVVTVRVMPTGGAAVNEKRSPICALVRTMVAEVAVVTPGLPVLVMVTSLSAISAAAPCSLKVLLLLFPVFVPPGLLSRLRSTLSALFAAKTSKLKAVLVAD